MKTYLITGAAQGLGRELAISLAKKNNKLILLDKDITTLNLFYDDLIKNFNCDVTLIPMDLLGATNQDYEQVKENLLKEYQQLDAVFLNSAFLPACTPIENLEFEKWYELMQVNLNANFHIIQMTIDLLKSTNDSKLIAVLDSNIKDKPAYYGSYGVAKAGLEQLIKTLAEETQLNCYLAHLPAFQSNTRSKQFPSENPNSIPTAETIAQQIIKELDKKQDKLIEKL